MQHLLRLGELVVDVAHQREVERIRRKIRVVDRAKHRLHIGEFLARHVLPQEVEHARLDIFGVDFAGWAGLLREHRGEVTGARAYIGDRLTLMDFLEQRDGAAGLFFLIALRSGARATGRHRRT